MTDSQLAQIIWDYMRYEQPLGKADVIIGLGSDDIRIAERVAELYHQGYADTVLFSGGLINDGPYSYYTEPESIVFRHRAIEKGVPLDNILVESEATNTGENIVKSARVLQENHISPEIIILVQKPFMLRRTYATFMKQWPNTNKPKIITTAVLMTMEEYVKDERYDFGRTVNIMVGDLQRIREYPKRGFQIDQNIPRDVWAAYEELVRRGYTEHVLR